MSQRTGIPLNMVAKAKKMLREGVSVEHIAKHYRCPAETIQSFADVIDKAKADEAKAEAKAALELVPVEQPMLTPAEPTAEDTPPPA